MTGGQDHSRDAVRQLLAEISAIAETATAAPWKTWAMSVLADPVGNSDLDDALLIAATSDPHRGQRTFNADFIAAARQDVPRLVAALTGTPEKPGVLDLHRASNAGRVCIEDGLWWPCPTYRAVAAALEEQP